MPKRQRAKWKVADPFVPMDGARLRVALTDRGLKVREVARLVRKRGARLRQVNESRLRYFIRAGQTRRTCHRSLHSALVAVLECPGWWLSGERPPLRWRYLRGFDTTSRAFLAADRLLGSVAKRLAPAPDDPDGPRFSDEEEGRLNHILRDLLDPRAWRAHVLRWRPSRHEPSIISGVQPMQPRRDARPDELERGVLALAEALTVVLAPWLRGDAVALELDALAALLPHGSSQAALTLEASPNAPEPGPAAADAEEFEIAAIDPLNREGLSPDELARFNILAVVVAHPGLSGSAIAGKLAARKADVLAELKRMARVRLVEDRADAKGSHYYALTKDERELLPRSASRSRSRRGGARRR